MARAGERNAARSVERSTSMYADDVRVAAQPRGAQRAATALGGDVDASYAVEVARKTRADQPRPVLAGVVDDRDARGDWNVRAEMRVQCSHARLEVALLVVHGDGDVHDGSRRRRPVIVHAVQRGARHLALAARMLGGRCETGPRSGRPIRVSAAPRPPRDATRASGIRRPLGARAAAPRRGSHPVE